MRGIFGLKICGKNSDEKFKWQKVITKIKSEKNARKKSTQRKLDGKMLCHECKKKINSKKVKLDNVVSQM
jgi:hypothetical protein